MSNKVTIRHINTSILTEYANTTFISIVYLFALGNLSLDSRFAQGVVRSTQHPTNAYLLLGIKST